jgi:YD repeat-containing protein
MQLEAEETSTSDGILERTEYTYPNEASWVPSALVSSKHVYDQVVEKKVFRNGTLKTNYRAYYDDPNNFVKTKESTAFGNGTLQVILQTRYALNGNILESTKRNGISEVFLWGHASSYPIAHIENATLNEVLVAMGNISEATLKSMSDANTPSTDYLNRINNLRTNLPSAVVVTYTFQPLVGLRKITDANGLSTSFDYDALGRLNVVKDNQVNIIKHFLYNYKQP